MGFIVQIPATLAGAMSEPSVSVPIDTVAKLAETATAEPLLDPSGVTLRLYAFLV